jgi:Domain of unknown function (DUF4747)
LVIECQDKFGSISPKTIEKYFRAIFDSEEIIKMFNKVELTLIPRSDQLESIFRLETLNQLELIIRRPNTDGLDDLDAEVYERLNRQNVEEERITLKAQSGFSISADKKTKALAHVAQLNGEVKGSGNDAEGKRVEKSTKKHPLIEVGRYITGETTAKDFLVVMANKVISKIKSMRSSEDRNG